MMKSTFLSAVCITALCASGAVAQDDASLEVDAERKSRQDTIVVTAQKREQSIQDVGIKVSAVSEQDIEKFDLSDTLRLATVIPSLTALDGSAGVPSFRIRGIGINEFSAAFEGPVGVHVDEVFLYKPVLASLGFFDVNRIEVLNGPQGTVFGRNTVAGAVNYYSNLPTDELEFGAKLSYGNFNRGEYEGYISGPVGENIAGRIAVQIKDHNGGPYFNLFNNEEIGQLDQRRIRGILEYDNDVTLIRGTFTHGSKEGDLLPAYGNAFQAIPNGPIVVTDTVRNPQINSFTVNQDYFQTTDTELTEFDFRVEQETSLGTITSITGYKDFERLGREDTDNTPTATFNIDWNTRLETFSQEIRLGGSSGAFTYLFGGYYESDELQVVEVWDSRDLFGIIGADDYTIDTESFALFANTEFSLTDTIDIIVGARYTDETVDINGENFGVTIGAIPINDFDQFDPADTFDRNPLVDSISEDAFNYKLGVNWKATDDALVYASWSTGFRSGGFQVSVGNFGNAFNPFNGEDTEAAELGVKSTWLDGNLTLNGNLFWMQVEGYQDTVLLPGIPAATRVNAGTLESAGIEADVTWTPDDYWTLNFGVATNNAEIVESDGTSSGLPLEGTTPPNAPQLALTSLVNYNTPLTSDLVLDATVSAQWQDERFLEVENSADHLVDAYGTIDATLALQSEDGAWEAAIWGRNLTDENYLNYINDLPGLSTFITVGGEPRTYGVSLSFKY